MTQIDPSPTLDSFSITHLQPHRRTLNFKTTLLKKQVAILHDGFIPHYRLKFFTLLNKTSGTKYVVFHGVPPSLTGHPALPQDPDFPNVRVHNYEISLFGKRLVYQSVIRKIIFGRFDAVVLGHEPRFLSNLVLFSWCKIIGKPVVWWGQGFQKEKLSGFFDRLIGKLVIAIKKQLACRANMFIVYTQGGSVKLLNDGVKAETIRVVRNTIDMEEQRRFHAEMIKRDPFQLRNAQKLRADSKVLLYIGRIYKEKKVDELLMLVEQLNVGKLCHSFVEVVVIGGGPELTNIQRTAEGIPGVHIVGELYDQKTVAEYLRIASALVIPGAVGLAVNHAFSQGVPVITREHKYHGPEVEYIVDGHNGLIVQGDFKTFVQATAKFLNSADDQKRLAKGALATRDELTLETMVMAFDDAVMRAMT